MIIRNIVIVPALLCLSCTPIVARIPGVLDVRSDAAQAPVDNATDAPPPVKKGAAPVQREGFDALVDGSGAVRGPKGALTWERRLWWPVLRSEHETLQLEPELAPAIGKERALRELRVKEGTSAFDCGVFACTMLVPIANLVGLLVLPTTTVTLDGVRVVPPPPPPPPPGSSDEPPAEVER